MKQILKHMAGIVLALIGLYVVWTLLTYKDSINLNTPNYSDDTVYTGDSVTIRLEKKNEESETYDIEYFVPKVTGSISPLVAAKINSALADSVLSIVNQFKIDHQNVFPGQKDTLAISLSNQSVTHQRYLSVEFVEYTYGAGAAHPLTYTHTLVFDLQNGKNVLLRDIFKEDSRYLEVISELVRNRLISQISLQSLGKEEEVSSTTTEEEIVNILEGVDTEQIIENMFFEEGILPRQENYKEFVLKQDGLEFVFGQYQVAPYVFGEQRVIVPYDDVAGLLSDSFKKSI